MTAVFSAVGWTAGGEPSFGTHGDLASASAIHAAAATSQHAIGCSWFPADGPGSLISVRFVPGSGWSWDDEVSVAGLVPASVPGADEAFVDPATGVVLALVDHTVVSITFLGFADLDPVASGAAAAAVAAVAETIDV